MISAFRNWVQRIADEPRPQPPNQGMDAGIDRVLHDGAQAVAVVYRITNGYMLRVGSYNEHTLRQADLIYAKDLPAAVEALTIRAVAEKISGGSPGQALAPQVNTMVRYPPPVGKVTNY